MGQHITLKIVAFSIFPNVWGPMRPWRFGDDPGDRPPKKSLSPQARQVLISSLDSNTL